MLALLSGAVVGVGVWLMLGFGLLKLRGDVRVFGGALISPDRLELSTGGPCQGDQELALLRETDVDVQVKVVGSARPFFQGGPECGGGIVRVQLSEPLGDRVVIDTHTRQVVSVIPFGPTVRQNQSGDSGVGKTSPDEAPHVSDLNGNGTTSPEAPPPQIEDPPSEAELQDLQAVADQYGITLKEAIDRYAWRDNFSLAAQRISEATPETFAGAVIVDGSNAWIAFTDTPPKAALDLIETFTNSHSGVSLEVRIGQSLTEAEIGEAVSAVHDAVRKMPGVLDALTSFDPKENRIAMTVALKDSAPDSILDDLQAIAENRLVELAGPDILDSMSVSIVRSPVPVIFIKE